MLRELVLILFSRTVLLPSCDCEMSVTGRIYVAKDSFSAGENKTKIPSLHDIQSGIVNVGDVINFTFVLNFTGTQDLESIDLLISGSSMKFLWSRPNGGIFVKMKTDVMPAGTTPNNMLQEIRPSDDKSFAIVTLQHNFMPLTSVEGRFMMKVTDLTNIRGIIEVQPTVGLSTTIYSESVTVYVPPFDVSRANPVSLGMNEVTVFFVDVQFPLVGLNNAYVKLYMPYNDNEAKMTVVDMVVTSVSAADNSIINTINSRLNSALTKYSQTGTSEEDTAVFQLPALNFTDVSNGIVGYKLMCQGRLQDFKGYSVGSTLDIGTSLKVNEDFMWVSITDVRISEDSATDQNRPVLICEMDEFQKSIDDGIIKSKLRLTIWHDSTSTGTAYNVSVVLYFPPIISYLSTTKRFYDTVRRIHETEDETTVFFELPRISYPHSSRIIFNITLDTEDDDYAPTDNIPIVFKVIYNGWRSDEEYETSFHSYEFKTELEKEYEKEYTDGQDCPCPWDEEDKSCACCHKKSCHCGHQNKNKCVACNNMIHCVDTLNGYYHGSYLQDVNGTTYSCDDAMSKRYGRTSASCMMSTEDGQETVLSPIVSTILGLDYKGYRLYGLSNNGQGYVISYDSGLSWHSIPPSVYTNSKDSNSFLDALLL